MKQVIFLGVFIVILCTGWTLYLEYDKKRFVDSLPQLPSVSDTQPIDTEEKNHSHSHEHTEETHTHEEYTNTDPLETLETSSTDVYDWRDDSVLDSFPEETDPWLQTDQTGAEKSEDEETYPPKDWHKTKDPVLRAEYLYAQLIKQFGDTPEVQAIADYELRAAQGIPSTLDEYIEFLEAQLSFWPNDTTLSTLKEMRRIKADGGNFVFEGRTQ